ncbi:hypothetical protein H6F89_33300 [Cyanobacteria bacterium FACHB-63]|nr:hypothetical protein [Cyanobacteria bacterium FACHB-63]
MPLSIYQTTAPVQPLKYLLVSLCSSTPIRYAAGQYPPKFGDREIAVLQPTKGGLER